MTKWVLRAVLVLALAGFGLWGYNYLFPKPEKAIRRQLLDLAKTASFSSTESEFSKAPALLKLISMFTPDIEISIDVPPLDAQTLTGIDDLRVSAGAIRQGMRALSVEFVDINITLTPNQQSAIANLTAKIRVPGEKEFFPQELKFSMKKVDGKWLIRKVETVKTLSMKEPSARLKREPGDNTGWRLGAAPAARSVQCPG